MWEFAPNTHRLLVCDQTCHENKTDRRCWIRWWDSRRDVHELKFMYCTIFFCHTQTLPNKYIWGWTRLKNTNHFKICREENINQVTLPLHLRYFCFFFFFGLSMVSKLGLNLPICSNPSFLLFFFVKRCSIKHNVEWASFFFSFLLAHLCIHYFRRKTKLPYQQTL